MYKLTISELNVLAAGYEIVQTEQEDQQHGVDWEDRAKLKDFDQRLKQGDL